MALSSVVSAHSPILVVGTEYASITSGIRPGPRAAVKVNL